MSTLRRRTILGGALGALAAPAAHAQGGKPYAGTTINASCFQTTYFTYLKEYFPQFEEKTGIKVNFTMQAFPVYNQRTDLELSTKGSAVDVCNVTFIYSGRWIGAGWMTNLDTFTKDSKMTPADWDPEDFAGGPQSAMKNAKGETFGFTWEAGAMILGAARFDLIERAGLGLPKTFDDLIKVCDAVHNKEGVAAFTADKLHHWNSIPYLMGAGGNVFKAPPENLTPTLDTPQAAQSAEWYANLLMKYGPDGILSYSDDQAMRSQMSGRANIKTQAITWMVPLAKHAESTVQKTVRYGLMPEGPKGNFPGSNSHGLGIPAGSKKKEAAWEFIKWALSKETVAMVVKKHGYPSVCRLSVIKSPEFKEVLTLNGQDVASLFLEVLQLGGKTGYMKYRTVPVYPQVGDKINKAIERVATKQQAAPAALKQAQAEAIQDLQKAGIKMTSDRLAGGAAGVARQQHRFFAYCVAPSLAVLAVITLLPSLYLLATSFTQLSLTRPETLWDFSQPLESYRQLLSDARLHNSVWVQIKLSFWTVLLQLLIGLGLALLLNMKSRLLEALRTVFLIPMVLPPIVVAIIWKVIYTPDISPMHGIFRAVGWNVPALITDPDWALTSIIIADTWEWFPFTMLMVLAALQMIPQELLDAAKVDGASSWQVTRHVTLPFITGILLVAGLFASSNSIKAFPLIFILTDGGPGNLTEVTNYYSYLQAFNFSYLGFSSAITVVLLAASIVLSWVIVRAVGWGVRVD